MISKAKRAIREHQLEFMLDDSWIDQLIAWADINNVPDLHYIEDLVDIDDETTEDYGFWVGLPRDVSVLLSIDALNLSWHNCTEIPEQIRYLTQLKILSFAHSPDGLQPSFTLGGQPRAKINEIPWWIAELENLEELDLSGNNIQYVPERLSRLKYLKKLYLNDNNISTIHSSFSQLQNLEVLWITGNQLTRMDFHPCLSDLSSQKDFYFQSEQSDS